MEHGVSTALGSVGDGAASPTPTRLTVQAELGALAGVSLGVPGRHGVNAVVVGRRVVHAQGVLLVLAVLQDLKVVVGHDRLVVLEPATSRP